MIVLRADCQKKRGTQKSPSGVVKKELKNQRP